MLLQGTAVVVVMNLTCVGTVSDRPLNGSVTAAYHSPPVTNRTQTPEVCSLPLHFLDARSGRVVFCTGYRTTSAGAKLAVA